MAQVISDPYGSLSTGLGQTVGAGLGTGIGSALQNLADFKVKQMQQQRTASGLTALGFEPRQASILSALPEHILQEVVKQKLVEPQNLAYAQSLQALLGGGEQPAVQQMPIAQQETPPYTEAPAQAASMQSQQMAPFPLQQQMEAKQLLAPGAAPTAQKAVPLSQQQATKLAEFGLQKQKMEREEQRDINKETAETYNSLNEAHRTYQDTKQRLDVEKGLVKKGKLPNPLLYSAMEALGIDLPGLMSPDAGVYISALQAEFAGLKQQFGARPTQWEAQRFAKALPTLAQTDEGKLRMLAAKEAYIEAGEIRYQAMREALKETKGKRTADFAERINDKTETKLDESWNKFKKLILGEEGPILGTKFSALPDASTMAEGTEITNKKTGKKLSVRNGAWAEV